MLFAISNVRLVLACMRRHLANLLALFAIAACSGNADKAAAIPPEIERDVRLLRATLLTDSALTSAIWLQGNDTLGKPVEGEIVFSPRYQRGVFRVIALAPNDSTAWQYELWIVDRTLGESKPVSGGRFNVGATQWDQMRPFRANTRVDAAVSFFVTVASAGSGSGPDTSHIVIKGSVKR